MFALKTPKITDEDFLFFQEYLLSRTGINLTRAKRDLLQTRLMCRLNELGLESYEEYRAFLQSLPANHPEWQNFVNQVTTNKTDFWREPAHFDYLTQTYLPEWCKRNPGATLQVWSAACSTGEEPYTLAAVLEKYFGGTDRFRITATDLDTEAVAYGRNGVYPRSRLELIPDGFAGRAFAFGSGELKDWARIKNSLRSAVEFRQLNLIEHPYRWPRPFDVIFCRNVFIYFRPETIESVVQALYASARPGALFAIGHAETLHGLRTDWKHVGPSLFRKEEKK